FQPFANTPVLHSFPTRRSSDLATAVGAVAADVPANFDAALAAAWTVAADSPVENQSVVLVHLISFWSSTINLADSSGLRLLSRRSEEHTSELQSRENLVCRLLL